MQHYENIPQYVKENAQFCCWRYKTVNGRITKVPYNPANGYHANVKKPKTFCDYTTAVSVADKYDGIGINVGSRIIAIDLDHCVEDGKLLPLKIFQEPSEIYGVLILVVGDLSTTEITN